MSEKVDLTEKLENLNTNPIENNRYYWKWISSFDIREALKMHKNLKKKLKQVWGEQNRTWMGAEYKNWIWFRKLKSEIFVIFCSKKGTSIELAYAPEDFRNSKKLGKIAIELCEELISIDNLISEKEK